jgi:hypothetical protein
VSVIRRPRFSPDRHGRFRLRLQAPERELLRSLPRQAQDLLARDDPSAARVFPVAYPDDPAAEADYRSLVGDQLLKEHQHALDTMATTVDADTLDADQLHQWLGALEVLRLVIGTRLDVTEDLPAVAVDDPRAAELTLYFYLTEVQGDAVNALATRLPPHGGKHTGGAGGGPAQE